MTRDLRYARSAYVMERLRVVEAMADRLQSAPMEVRRLGLPLAVAAWDRDRKPELVRLVAGWLYGGWGMLRGRAVPQDAVALLGALGEDEAAGGAVLSAAEREAEELMQAAKVLADAAVARSGGGRGS
jgi:hypothetical protein